MMYQHISSIIQQLNLIKLEIIHKNRERIGKIDYIATFSTYLLNITTIQLLIIHKIREKIGKID